MAAMRHNRTRRRGRSRLGFLFKVLCVLALLCGAAMAECPQISVEDYPIVDGSTATLPLSYALMQAAAGVDEETAMTSIRHTKTTASFSRLVYDEADLLLVYEPAQEAYDIAKEAGVELEIAPIGVDALVFLINDKNPVQSLTREQLVGIYSGEYTNWNEVGGEDMEIIAYQRNESSGSQVMMEAQCMQGVPMMEPPTSLMVADMGMLVDAVAAYRNTADSIGYSVLYYVSNMYIQQGIRLVSVNDVAPENATVASGEYPFTQQFYAVIRADAAEDSPERMLFNWLQTEEGKTLIESAGYVAAR